MITNRYFVLPIPQSPNSSLWNIVVESENTVTVINNKMIVKLAEGDEQTHGILNGIQEYDHAGILVKVAELEAGNAKVKG